MKDNISRRRILRSVGISGLAISGVNSVKASGSIEKPPEGTPESPTDRVPTDLNIYNNGTEKHTIDISLKNENETVVYSKTVTLPGLNDKGRSPSAVTSKSKKLSISDGEMYNVSVSADGQTEKTDWYVAKEGLDQTELVVSIYPDGRIRIDSSIV